jgi:hypothetical protein
MICEFEHCVCIDGWTLRFFRQCQWHFNSIVRARSRFFMLSEAQPEERPGAIITKPAGPNLHSLACGPLPVGPVL